MEAFRKIVPEDAQRTDAITKDQIRTGLAALGCYLPYHEVNELMCAFDCSPDGYVTAHNWVTVFCTVKVTTKRAASPQRGNTSAKARPAKAISLASDSIHTYEPFSGQSSVLDPRLTVLPSSQASFLTLRRNHSSAITEESGYISSASISDASSLQPVPDTHVIATSQPGTRLIQAARAFTNYSGPSAAIDTSERLMRSLGSLVYSGPGRHHEVLGQLDTGGVVMVSAVSGPWARVRVESMEGWVPLQHLDPTVDRKVYEGKDNELRAVPALEAKSKAAVYIRKEPDWAAKAVKKLGVQEVTEVLGASNHWLKVVTASGYKGWLPQPDTDLSGYSYDVELTQHSQKKSITQPSPIPVSTEATALQAWIKALRPSPISQQSKADIEARIAVKMEALLVEHTHCLNARIHKGAFREQLVAKWKNVAVARAFVQWKGVTRGAGDNYSAQVQAQTAYVTRARTGQRSRIQEEKALLRSRLSQRAQSVRLEMRTLQAIASRSESVKLQERSIKVRVSRQSNSAAIRSRIDTLHTQKCEAAATIRWQSQSSSQRHTPSYL